LEEPSKIVDTLGTDLSITHLLGKSIFIAMLPSEGGAEQKTNCMTLVEKITFTLLLLLTLEASYGAGF